VSELTGYWFRERNEGYPVYLELPFCELFENQDSLGNFDYEGLELRRDLNLENFGVCGGGGTKAVLCGPLNREINDAIALHPDQVSAELHRYYRSVHPGIELRADGGFNLSSRKARAALLKDRGCYDRDGGYGDG